MVNKKEDKNKIVFILIKVKPKYLKEFIIMMVACQALCQRNKSDSFNWNKILSKEKKEQEEKIRLIEFLNRHFAIECVKTEDIDKIEGGMVIEVPNGKKPLVLRLNCEKTKVYLTIGDCRPYELVAENKNGELNIYQQKHDELAEILEFFPIFGLFDFYLKISGEYEKIIRTMLVIQEKFSIYIDETHTLTSFEISDFLSNDGTKFLKTTNINKNTLNDCDNAKVINLCNYLGKETIQRLLSFKQELIDSTNDVKDGYEDQRFVLIKVKPASTEKFFIAINLIKKLCEDSTSPEFAKINSIYYIVGQFDYLLEINRNNENKICRTIFRIRETLGDYIFDTVTIKKIDLLITNDEIKKIFKNILGEEYILNKCGEKIPNENNKSCTRFNLEEISQAETSSLRNLLKTPKFLLKSEISNKRIEEMENRIEKLEKIIHNE